MVVSSCLLVGPDKQVLSDGGVPDNRRQHSLIGVYQPPGAVDKMQKSPFTRMVGFHLVDGAGHWVQQEQPEQVSMLLIQFLREHALRSAEL